MSRPIRFRSAAKSSTTLLGIVLVATVALCGWLALQAYGAARSHRETTEAILRDYAEIAAAEYARTARFEISRFFDVVFDEVPRRARGDRLPPLLDVERELDDAMWALDCRCPAFREPVALLRADLSTGETRVEPPDLGSATVDAVVKAIVERSSASPTDRYGFFQLDAPSPEGVADVTFATVRGPAGELVALYAILLEADALGQLAAHWHRSTQLLPDAIAGDLVLDSVLHVSLRHPAGREVFASPVAYPLTYSARESLEASLGSWVVTAAIRPEAADQLIIGGVPRSRLPVTLALLALALVVGTAGLWEIRRHDQLGRLREDFISSVSHELRTPLTQIRMLAELQADGKLRSEEERGRAIRVVRREAQRLTQLVENVLQFSRLQAVPRSGRSAGAVDVDEEVDEVVASFRLLADQSRSSIETETEPGLRVSAHREAVRRILINLLDNALKYGPPGQIIRVGAHAHGDRVRLTVRDEGPGIPEADREAIWEPYRRLARDVDSPRPGSGVGLAVVRSLAAEYDGAAWLERDASTGASFVVELPRWEAPRSAQGAAASLA